MKRFNFLFLFSLLFLVSCEPYLEEDILDNIQSSSTTLNIRLTDGPIDLEEVNIDLQQVFVKGPGGFEEIPLGTNVGIYDLLDLQNGIDVLIASADIQLSQIKEVRLVLGENNSVVVDGEPFELKVPSGSQSGLKIKVCLDLTDMTEYDLILDFDAGESVHKTGNGKYIMKPVIRALNPDAKCGDEEEEDYEEEEEGLSLDDLPEDVITWLQENYDGYEFEVEQGLLCNKIEIYLITATLEEEKVYLFFDLAGFYWQKAVKMPFEELPKIIIDKVIEEFPDYEILDHEHIFRITTFQDKTRYQVRLQNENGIIDLIYEENGIFVCDNSNPEEEEEEEEDDENITPDDIPEEVIEFINQTYPNINFSGSSQTFCDGSELYVLEGGNGSKTVLLYFDLDWNFVQDAKWFDTKGLPDAVTASIAKDYPNYNIMNTKTWEITLANDDKWYRVYLKQDNSSEKIYVIYTEDGLFVCEED